VGKEQTAKEIIRDDAMKKKIQIFVSSTYTDLIEERQAAVSAILKAGHIPAGMELFTAGDESQMETIKRWIDESDVFMLILGGRYGSIEPNTSLSYTELEYDYAVNSGKPYFAVVIEESALEQKVRERGTDVIEIKNTRELDAFRKKVLNRTSAFYRDMRDISLAVYETVSDFLVRYDFKGWVSGNDIPDIQSLTEQITKLREENKRLAEDNTALYKGTVFTSSEESDFNYIRQRLDRDIEFSAALYRQKEGEKNGTKVCTEIYRVNLLRPLIDYLNKGYHTFRRMSLEIALGDTLNKVRPVSAPDTKRNRGFNGIKDNIALELQTYGLAKFTEQGFARDPSDNVCQFTEKMYKFKYWLDYNDYIPELSLELVSNIEEVIKEPPQPKEEVPALSTIKEIDRTFNFKAQRNRWRTTEEGVIAAQQEFERLCDDLKRKVNRSNSESETFKIDFSREGKNLCQLSSIGVSMTIAWSCKHPNTLDESVLTVSGERTRFEVEGVQSFTGQDNLPISEYDFDMNKALKVVWRWRQDNHEYTTDDLTGNILTDLINLIRNRIVQGK
jgi:hypothetical protein